MDAACSAVDLRALAHRIEPVVVGGPAAPLLWRSCTDAAALHAVFGLRQRVWMGKSDYLLSNHVGRHPAEDEHDASAFHCALFDGERAVAACRWTASGPRGFEAESACALPAESVRERAELLQVSRVVVDEPLRRSLASGVLLREACRELLAHTAFRHWLALCVPRLAEHYVRFGGRELPGFEAVLQERHGNTYRVVRGTLDGSITAIDAMLVAGQPGTWTLKPAAAPLELVP